MRIFARHGLVPVTLTDSDSALVLEGDWPEQQRTERRWSLDRQIDARQGWIDRLASEMTERLAAEPTFRLPCAEDQTEASLAWINALQLRYYFVKLLRVVAFFQSVAMDHAEPLSLTFQRERDEDYRRLIACIATAQGRECQFEELPPPVGDATQANARPANSWLRRLAGELNQRGDAAWESIERCWSPDRSRKHRPILLCGNPHVLDAVCRELVQRRQPACWLYDRFAFGNWIAWRRLGVRQLACNSSLAAPITIDDALRGKWMACGVDLASTLHGWLDTTARQRAAAQQHLWMQVEAHFERLRPSSVVVDEDATPLKRIVVAAARRRGVASLVVQHGAPRVRFGFAPLAAERFLAWGEASRQQLEDWGVPAEKIVVTGSPRAWPRLPQSAVGLNILLFTTVPPSDARPDAVEYHLTRQTHDELIHLACAAAARLPGFELVLKLHPRGADPERFAAIARLHPTLRFRTVKTGTLKELLPAAACVLNCGSSAGIEAASYGSPVIELLPTGSVELTPTNRWGMLGAASTPDQLDALLRRALGDRQARCRHPHAGDVFAATGRRAAANIVDQIALTAKVPNVSAPRQSNNTSVEAAA